MRCTLASRYPCPSRCRRRQSPALPGSSCLGLTRHDDAGATISSDVGGPLLRAQSALLFLSQPSEAGASSPPPANQRGHEPPPAGQRSRGARARGEFSAAAAAAAAFRLAWPRPATPPSLSPFPPIPSLLFLPPLLLSPLLTSWPCRSLPAFSASRPSALTSRRPRTRSSGLSPRPRAPSARLSRA